MRRYNSSFKPRSLKRLENKSRNRLILSIILIIGIGYFIISWGLPVLIGSLSFLNKYKPQQEVVESIEDTAIAPPVLNIPFEATSSPTIKILGYSQPNSKVEIYFDDELKSTVETGSEGNFTTEEIELALGTNNIYGKTVNEKGNKSLPSKNIKLIFNNEKPILDNIEPQDNHQIKGGDRKVRVSGKTDPNNSVTINGLTVILNGDGSFVKEMPLNDGENTITIIASSQTGSTAEIQRKVIYSPE